VLVGQRQKGRASRVGWCALGWLRADCRRRLSGRRRRSRGRELLALGGSWLNGGLRGEGGVAGGGTSGSGVGRGWAKAGC